MKIEVNRINTNEGDLVFNIKISKPTYVNLKLEENQILSMVNDCQKRVEVIDSDDNLKDSVVNILQIAKTKTFERVLNQIKSSINEDLESKMKPIKQEIYNWLYDHQNNPLKNWMLDLDPQRTKYYFDNDITSESNYIPQESEHEEEDDDGWEED